MVGPVIFTGQADMAASIGGCFQWSGTSSCRSRDHRGAERSVGDLQVPVTAGCRGQPDQRPTLRQQQSLQHQGDHDHACSEEDDQVAAGKGLA